MNKITYENKQSIVNLPEVSEINKVTANDMNQIKSVVNSVIDYINNNNFDSMDIIDISKLSPDENNYYDTAINNAISEISNGCILYVPKGVWDIDNTININKNHVYIVGESRFLSKIRCNSSINSIMITGSNITIDNLSITGGSVINLSSYQTNYSDKNLIYLNKANNVLINNVYIGSTTYNGLFINNTCDNCNISNVIFSNCNVGLIDNGSMTSVSDVYLYHCLDSIYLSGSYCTYNNIRIFRFTGTFNASLGMYDLNIDSCRGCTLSNIILKGDHHNFLNINKSSYLKIDYSIHGKSIDENYINISDSNYIMAKLMISPLYYASSEINQDCKMMNIDDKCTNLDIDLLYNKSFMKCTSNILCTDSKIVINREIQ